MSKYLSAILVCLSVPAHVSAQPVVDIFDKEVVLKADCKIMARPSALDSNTNIQCNEGTIRILSNEKNEEGLAESDPLRPKQVERAQIGKLERILIRFPGSENYGAALVCDKEICVQFFGRKPVLNEFLALISEDLVIK